jgi:hypothetical protein
VDVAVEMIADVVAIKEVIEDKTETAPQTHLHCLHLPLSQKVLVQRFRTLTLSRELRLVPKQSFLPITTQLRLSRSSRYISQSRPLVLQE